MRLVYTATGKPVQIGDSVTLRDQRFTVDYFREPHKPDSEGKVTLLAEGAERPYGTEFYVSIIGAEWIDREDRGDLCVFNDGVFCVIIGRYQVALGKQDAAIIHVPRGHAYFDRVCEATTRRAAEDLYNELAEALA